MLTNEWCETELLVSHSNKWVMLKELLVLNSSTWNHLIVSKQIRSNSLKMELPTNNSLTNPIYKNLTLCKQTINLKLFCVG